MNNISISVITATWNCEDTIQECLNSINSQNYRNIEHIVIDGGSTDNTLKLLKASSENFSTFISEKDNGIYYALNKGIRNATGDIIGFLHADDVYANSSILNKVAKIFLDPSVDAVYGDLQYINNNERGEVVRKWKSNKFNRKQLKMGWMPPHPTLFVRKSWYEKYNNFDEKFLISADYLSILQFFMDSNFKSVYIPNVFIKMRLGGESNKSIGNVIKKMIEDYTIMKQCGIFPLRAILWKNLSKIKQFF
jgi:glycosyltransferase involved in cell wall biosynthesis